ncbi:MAG: branched-chain amino acid ABC transporter permease [Bacteroidales bacterium]
MDINNILIHLLNGLFWGSLIGLIAMGLSLVYGQLGIINLAHGELYMLGAVVAYYCIGIINSFWLTLLVSPILIIVLGLFIERFLLRPIERNTNATLIVTYAISICFQYVVLFFFGGAPQRISEPIGITLNLLGIGYPLYRIFIIVITFLLFTGFIYFLKHTRYGLWIRGTGQDIYLATVLGISTQTIYLITFGLGSGFAALAGVLASPIVAVEFRMGADIIILAFMASIIGGFGNLKGTFIASIIIGVLDGALLVFLESTYAKVSLLLISCIFLVLRPQGLFTIPKSSRRI